MRQRTRFRGLTPDIYVDLKSASCHPYRVARKLRKFVPGVPMHVIQRGNNRSSIFFGDDDRTRYLDFLVDASHKHDCPVHCYVLMGNHVHLLMSPANEHSLANTMKLLNNRYVWHFNKLHERTGGLWDGRYIAKHVVTDRYLCLCFQYIELNPVRAGICKRARGYPWSSHRYHAYGECDEVVTPHETYLALGKSDITRRRRYRRWFRKDQSEEELAAIRGNAPETPRTRRIRT